MNGDPAEAHLLVIDDDSRLRDLLRRYLVESGFRITTAGDAAEARLKLQSIAFDLLIVDVMMPGESGLALTESLRQSSDVPILLLTAMAEPGNRIEGLERGADDYLTKPFDFKELLARIRALLRRPREIRPESIRICDLVLNTGDHTAWRAGRSIGLTAKEYALLEFLMLRPNRIVNREQIAQHVWDENFDPLSNVIDVYVRRLRAKIDEGFPRPLIHTRRGEGYLLSAEPEGPSV
jgi:DNA-binding response OmpR family regulator